VAAGFDFAVKFVKSILTLVPVWGRREMRQLVNGYSVVLIFWVATPCRFVGRYQRFGGTYCLHLQCGNNARVRSSFRALESVRLVVSLNSSALWW
jgi:hypothetical protein